MKLHSFNTIYPTAESLYGVNSDPINLEDIALIGWELIGNRHTKLYRYTAGTVNKRLQLPCNVELIEAVTGCSFDGRQTGANFDGIDYGAQYTESYIDGNKHNTSTLYSKGTLLNYREEGDELVFDKDYSNVSVLYHGIIADEDGLPMLTDKEIYAIAAYIAYSHLYKKSILAKDGNLLQLSAVIKNDWLRACSAARVSGYLSQNDMNAIADVKTR